MMASTLLIAIIAMSYNKTKGEKKKKRGGGNGHTWCCLLQIDKTIKKT
jgi:hypothetical protein